ncbi:MAG: fucose isomerase [Candidatus Heimdallarchaeota archaeon]|nr:MAG: fucose isomerase [Candidatus Heimdallarchaeota archaeon]
MSAKKQKANSTPKMKLGIVSFTDPRREVHLIKKREEYIRKNHLELKQKLESDGFTVIDPQTEFRKQNKNNEIWGINNIEDVKEISKIYLHENISAIILGCWAWNEPNVPLALAKKMDVPIALVTKNDPLWPGITAVTSTGATFWQLSNNYHIKTHNRFIVSSKNDYQDLVSWARASCAVNYLRNGTLLLWGGSPALNMEHLNDDIPILKSFLIDDIITEDQNTLIERVELMLSKNQDRISDFIKWLNENNCRIIYDNKMTTEDSIKKQIALYFAAKDIILQRIESGVSIIGASIKCQPELSINYGVTGCLIPAFLPFPFDSEGEKPITSTTCEGDIKGLLTSALLFGLNKEIPPLFGDLKVITEDYFVIANCGGASAFYAANSNDPKISLSRSTIKPQCQGESGGAFGFYTPTTPDEATFAQLIRLDGNYILQFGVGKLSEKYQKPKNAWGESWPHTVVDLKIPKELFVKAIGSNHFSLILGNFKNEMKYIAKILSIPTVELDLAESVEGFLQNVN